MSSNLNVFVENSNPIQTAVKLRNYMFVHFLSENLITSNAKPLQTKVYVCNPVRSVLMVPEKQRMVSHQCCALNSRDFLTHCIRMTQLKPQNMS